MLHHCNFMLFLHASAPLAPSYLALLVQHGQCCQVLTRVEPRLGVVLLGHGAVHVVPGVHEVVTETVVVEVLTLKDQSQSPAEAYRGEEKKTQHATDETGRIMRPEDQKVSKARSRRCLMRLKQPAGVFLSRTQDAARSCPTARQVPTDYRNRKS